MNVLRRLGTLLTLSLVVICVSSGYAAPTSKEDAKKAVKGWLKATGRPLKTKMSQEILGVQEFKNDSGAVIYYIVNMKPEGFVVISPDDLIEPIIAFSGKGKFVADSKYPMYSMLQTDLPNRLKHMKKLKDEAKKAKKEFTPNESQKKSQFKWKKFKDKAEGIESQLSGVDKESPTPSYITYIYSIDDTRVNVLLETEWAQGGFNGDYLYNYYTPEHLVCGCVATTLAQILRYHKYPTVGIGQITSTACSVNGVNTHLTTRGGDGLGGPYDWDNMPGIPDASITVAQRQAIGALLYDAGVVCNMAYGSTSYSSNNNAKYALRDEFQYGNAIQASYPDATEFATRANSNFEAGLPCMVEVPGHSICTDGYGYNGGTMYHHFNMGWGSGGANAWYQVPNVYTYDTIVSLTYNIFPTGTGEIISGRVTNAIGLPQAGITVTADSGSNQYTDVTDDEGNYGIQVPSNTSFTVSCPGAAPKNLTTGLSADYNTCGNLWGQDFNINNGKQLFYLPTTFNESTLNDGALINSCVITLYDDTFTANVTSNINVTNLPTGLTAQFTRNSNTKLTLSLTGNAVNHGLSDDVSNLTLTFQNGAFTGGDASAVTDSVKSDLVIDFHDTTETLPYAVDAPLLTWTFSGHGDWFYQTAITHDGIDAGKSGPITHSQNSTMQTTVVGPGTMTFWWKVDSEANYDWLKVYVNGAEKDKISGDVNWAQKTLTIPSGTAIVKWSYVKDSSRSIPDDCAWVDEVIFTPAYVTYSVTYEGNGHTGGAVPQPNPQTKIEGVDLTLASNSGNLTKSGFTFAGWNTAIGGNGTDYSEGGTYSTDADLTLYAKWTDLPTYTVTYNGNGNTDGTAPANQTKIQGVDLTLASNSGSLVKLGSVFIGWNTADDGSGTDYSPGAIYTTDANLDLYAKWSYTGSYPITVANHSFEEGQDGSGGSINKAPWKKSGTGSNLISIQELSGIVGQADAAPDGTDTTHYTNGTGDNIYQVLGTTLAANTTYTLSVDVGDRTTLTAQPGSIRLGYVSASPTSTNDYGLNLLTATIVNNTVPVNGAAADDGWETWVSTFTTGAAPAGLGQPLRVELVTDAGVQTLWDNVRLEGSEAVSGYSVTYKGNTNDTGTVPVDATRYDENDTVTVLGNTGNLFKTGHTFNSWNTAFDGTGTARAPSSTFTMGTENVTLYAQWTVVPTYTVTYFGNESTGGAVPSAQIKTQGFDLTLATHGTMARTGYKFTGWNTAAGGGGTAYSEGEVYTVDADLALYAQWSLETYTVSFNANGGTAATPATIDVNYGSPYGTLATTSRTGYSFDGWFTQASGGSQVTAATQVTNASNHTLHAHWTGTDPEMDVSRDSSPIVDGSEDSISGTTAGADTQLIYAVLSSGTADITVANAVVSGETNCSVVINSQPSSPVAPSEGTTLVLTVTPTASGYWCFDISMATNDPNENPYNWKVSGNVPFTTSFTASSDTYISGGAPDTNYADADKLQLCVGSYVKYGLVQFDLSSLAGANVTSATLDLTAGGSYSGNLTVCNNISSWDGATATWNDSNTVIGSSEYGTGAISASEGTPVPPIALDTTVVQNWIDSPLANYGMSLKSDYNTVNNTKFSSICSVEHATPAYWPTLTLTYTIPPSQDGFTIGSISGSTTEAGGTATFTVKLNSQPTDDVIIGISSNDTTEGTVSPTSLTFTNGNWNVNQIVTVTGVNDSAVDGNVAYNIVTAAATSTDTNYNGLDPSDVSVINTDNDYQLTVSNDGNGSTAPSGASVQTMGNAVAISATASPGYSFLNWTVISGSPSFGNANQASTTVTASATAEIQANFSANQYTVTLDKRNGTGGDDSVTATFGSAMPAATAPTRGGYVFGGYFTAVDGGGTQYYNADMSSSQNWDLTSDTTLYAMWTTSGYTVTFEGNGGGTPTPTTTSVTFGSTYGALATVTRTGHTFNGWFTQASGGTEVTSDTTVTATDDHSLYAQWTINQYTITFDSAGGSAVDPITQDYDTAVVPPADPTKAGYTFSDWNPAIPATMPEGGLTVTAQWNAVPVVEAGPDQTISLSQAVEWSPADLTTAAWYDADDAGTLWADTDATTPATTSVARWDDKSGSGVSLQESSNMPVLGTFNGRNIMTFQGVSGPDQYLVATGGIPTAAQFFAVTRYTAIESNRPTLVGDALQNAHYIQLADDDYNGVPERFNGTPGYINAASTTGAATQLADPCLIRTNRTISNSTLSVGKDRGASNRCFDGFIAEIVIFDTLLSLENQAKMEGYLAWKWGLQGNLPSGHPHEFAKPMSATAVAVATLNGTVTDDDAPTTTWSVQSPTTPEGLESTVTFGNASATNTTATFTTEGIYTLRLTANDGSGEVYDECVITVGTPEIKVSGNTVEIISGSTDTRTEDGTAFGNVTIGSPITQTFVIENTELYADLLLTGDPNIVEISAGTDFSVSRQAVSPVSAGAFTEFDITFAPTVSGYQEATVTIANNDPDGNEAPYTFVVNATGEGGVSATIATTHIFYNNSAWDGDAGASANDDLAIASTKSALEPTGTATFANYTSYDKGINGIMIDVNGTLPATLDKATDFAFRIGNDNDPTGWTALAGADLPSVTVTTDGGGAGIDRITLIWTEANAPKNTWLQVTVLASGNVGLDSDYVFYYGNAIGETGNNLGDALVNASDALGMRANPKSIGTATLDDVCDCNRDKAVNATDVLRARSNATTTSTMLQLITVP